MVRRFTTATQLSSAVMLSFYGPTLEQFFAMINQTLTLKKCWKFILLAVYRGNFGKVTDLHFFCDVTCLPLGILQCKVGKTHDHFDLMVRTLAPTVWKYIHVLYEKIMMENHRTFIKQTFMYKFVHITCRNLGIFVRNRQAYKFTLQYNIIIILGSDGGSGRSLVAVVVCISMTDRQTAIHLHTCTAHYHHPWPHVRLSHQRRLFQI